MQRVGTSQCLMCMQGVSLCQGVGRQTWEGVGKRSGRHGGSTGQSQLQADVQTSLLCQEAPPPSHAHSPLPLLRSSASSACAALRQVERSTMVSSSTSEAGSVSAMASKARRSMHHALPSLSAMAVKLWVGGAWHGGGVRLAPRLI